MTERESAPLTPRNLAELFASWGPTHILNPNEPRAFTKLAARYSDLLQLIHSLEALVDQREKQLIATQADLITRNTELFEARARVSETAPILGNSVGETIAAAMNTARVEALDEAAKVAFGTLFYLSVTGSENKQPIDGIGAYIGMQIRALKNAPTHSIAGEVVAPTPAPSEPGNAGSASGRSASSGAPVATTPNSGASAAVLMAVEFGYKCAEKGMSVQAALEAADALDQR